jgi:hypothetical protein
VRKLFVLNLDLAGAVESLVFGRGRDRRHLAAGVLNLLAGFYRQYNARDSGALLRLRGVDRNHPCMCVRAGQEHRVKHVWAVHVERVLGAAGSFETSVQARLALA